MKNLVQGVLVASLCLFSVLARADTGHVWLAGQIDGDGRVSESANPQATALQAAADVAAVLHEAGVSGAALTAARSYVMSQPAISTEILSRQIIIGRQAGSDVTALVNLLLMQQNPEDGGFGHLELWQSTPLDTAFAIQALHAAGKGRDPATAYAVDYLLSRQGGDGSWQSYDTDHTTYVTALAMRALHDVRLIYTVAAAITSGRDALLAQRNPNELWRDRATSAIALTALTPTYTDASELDASFAALTADAGSDGSYDDDAWTTAWVLRALRLRNQTRTNPDEIVIKGVVVDGETLLPLGNAVVVLSGPLSASRVTGVAGTFEFRNLSPGDYALTLTRTGYTGIQATTTAARGSLVDFGNLVLLKSPLSPITATLRGTVINADTGMPIAGAAITIDGQGAVATAMDGTYLLPDVVPGTIVTRAGALGYDSAATTLTLTAGQVVAWSPQLTHTPDPDPAATQINGRIVDALGAPLAGAQVVLFGSDQPVQTTSATGLFAFSALNPGDYALSVSLSGYYSLASAASAALGKQTALGDLPLSAIPANEPEPTAGRIVGIITDAATGESVGGAIVTASGIGTQVTGNDGRYTFENVAPGDISLSATASGYGAAQGGATLVAGGTLVFSPALRVEVQGTDVTVRGIVTDAQSGAPLAGALVVATGANQRHSFTTADGRYELQGLSPGIIALRAWLAGYDEVAAGVSAASSSIVAFSPRLYPSNSTPADANMASIFGTLVDSASGMPIAGATVRAEWAGAPSVQTTTDAAGAYRIGGIDAAAISIEFIANGFVSLAMDMPLTPLAGNDLGEFRLRRPDVVQLLPDLSVMAIDTAALVEDPQTLQISGDLQVTVANTGTAPAYGPFSVALSMPESPTTFTSTVTVSGTLGAGESRTVTLPATATRMFRNSPVAVTVDSDQLIAELSEANNRRDTSAICRGEPAPIGDIAPVQKWRWSSGSSTMMPIVGPMLDTNLDGRIDRNDDTMVAAITNTSNTFSLRIINGKTGVSMKTFPSTYHPYSQSIPALGDVDGDGSPDFVMYTQGPPAITAFRTDGTLLWRRPIPEAPGFTPALVLADLDGDGHTEVIGQRQVIDYQGNVIFTANLGYTVTPKTSPNVVDINGDGMLEVLFGGVLFDRHGNELWRQTGYEYAFSAVGNFDSDPDPEIVFVTNNGSRTDARVSLVNHDGTLKWRTPFSGGGGGAPTIGDTDGDGVPEIGVAGYNRYAVLNANGAILRTAVINDASSHVTGSTMFDFNGDGKTEILYADEDFLRIYRGDTLGELFKVANSSATIIEMPVIADIDGDGHAEFVVTSNGNSATNGVRAFQGASDHWMPTRAIWNQHTYHINNIDDDGRVPAHPAPSWKTHNTYRLNALQDRHPLDSADVTVGFLRFLDQGAGLPVSALARVGNAGTRSLDAGAVARFYAGDPQSGGALLGTVALPALAVNASADIRLDGIAPPALGTTIFVVVDAAAIQPDCRAMNNVHSAPFAAADQQGALTVTLDAALYGPAAPMTITVAATNSGAVAGAFGVALAVVDAEGRLVTDLPAESIAELAGGATLTLPREWNTAQTLAGDYRVVATLTGANGAVLAEAFAGFMIGADASQPLASISVATDRPLYHTTDNVLIDGLARNLATNVQLAGTDIAVEVRDAQGALIATLVESTADLPSGGSRGYARELSLNAAGPGIWTARALLRSGTGAVLAQATASFAVEEQLTRALAGGVSVGVPSLFQGAAQTCSGTVTLVGTQALAALPVRLIVQRLSAGDAPREVATQTIALSPGGSDTLNAIVDTQTDAIGNYACVLQYRNGEAWESIGYQTYVLQMPPVVLAGSVSAAEADVTAPQAQVCNYTVSNSGGGSAQNLQVITSLLDAAGQTINEQTTAMTLAGNSSQTLLRSYATEGMAAGNYVCRLETAWNGERVQQGESSWTLQVPVCPVDEPAPARFDSRDARDLIVNGSFEEFGPLNHTTWGTFPSIPGWNAKYGPLEIQTTAIDGIPQQHGNARLELDSQNNAEVTQQVPTDVGGQYVLRLWYAPRVDQAGTDTNDVEIWWNGALVHTLSGDTAGWREVEINVAATRTQTDLTLRAVGDSNKLGGLIDQVRLYCTACRRSNLVYNGSFERHDRLPSASLGLFSAIPGWDGAAAFEIQHDGAHTVNVLEGHAQLELDTQLANARAGQDILTAPGKHYDLALFHAPRVPVNSASNAVEIWWAGQRLDTVTANRNGWSMKRYSVTANAPVSRLEFRGAGVQDDKGGVIDHVQLACPLSAQVALPGITSAALATATVGTPWSYTPTFENVSADALHLTLEQGPVGMTVDAGGVLNWPNPATGEYPVQLRIDDGCGGTSVQTFTLQVVMPEGCPLP